MSLSSRFICLSDELNILRDHLLPKLFEPTGVYPDQQLTQTFAYSVLAHAEIEGYLEDRASEVVLNALKHWKETGTTCRTLISLIAFSGCKMDSPPKFLNQGQKDKLKLAKKLDCASTAFHTIIKNNHGLKEANILSLLLSIGVDSDDLDSTWLSTMNSFGETRGTIAHKSASFCRIKQQPDPKIALETIEAILVGLEDVDKLFNKLIT